MANRQHFGMGGTVMVNLTAVETAPNDFPIPDRQRTNGYTTVRACLLRFFQRLGASNRNLYTWLERTKLLGQVNIIVRGNIC
ncbi:MAG UNVERIFIED_CONTAM: hypothetical protein LVT10_17165 [Anaerolineae bacterium]